LRIHDVDRDETVIDAALYLTTAEAAELLAHLHNLVTKPNARTCSIIDLESIHKLKVHIYNPYEFLGFTGRQKMILTEDV